MSTSYQDIDTRLVTVERKLDFVMRQIKLTLQQRSTLDPSVVLHETQQDLLTIYHAMQSGALTPVEDTNDSAS